MADDRSLARFVATHGISDALLRFVVRMDSERSIRAAADAIRRGPLMITPDDDITGPLVRGLVLAGLNRPGWWGVN